MYYKHNDYNPFILALIIIALLIIVLFINNIVGSAQYNDGICSCGGTYEFKQAIGHQVTTDYLYICDKCGRTIEIPNYYPPK